jgi:hypothetical protein
MAEQVVVGDVAPGDWFPDWDARYQKLIDEGLEARLEVVLGEAWDDEPRLWMIEAHPLRPAVEWAPRIAGFPYHISIAEEGNITMQELASIFNDFHDKTMRIRFWERHGSYLVVGGDFWTHEALHSAHARGKYRDRYVHISF